MANSENSSALNKNDNAEFIEIIILAEILFIWWQNGSQDNKQNFNRDANHKNMEIEPLFFFSKVSTFFRDTGRFRP